MIATFTDQEVRDLLGVYNFSGYLSARKKLILAIVFDTGARNTEICSVQEEDIRDNAILIHGKGNKERHVPLTPYLKKRWSNTAFVPCTAYTPAGAFLTTLLYRTRMDVASKNPRESLGFSLCSIGKIIGLFLVSKKMDYLYGVAEFAEDSAVLCVLGFFSRAIRSPGWHSGRVRTVSNASPGSPAPLVQKIFADTATKNRAQEK